MKRRLVRLIPNFLRPTLKGFYYLPRNTLYRLMDVIDRLKGTDSLTVPRSMLLMVGGGSGDFLRIGQEFKNYFIEFANLQPSDRVLDVGCGVGRMAVPLTNYLSKEGEYQGFDIVKKGIDWCQSHITPKFSNFHFQHSDVYNKHYNPNGKVQARNFQFPFGNESFDFVFLTSVFTHMLPSDMENYLSEISRVLRTEGKCFITFFILNEESQNLIHSGRSHIDFRYEIQGCLTNNENDPEANIAYRENSVLELFDKYGVRIIQPIHYGSWCERDTFMTYQDMIIAAKIRL